MFKRFAKMRRDHQLLLVGLLFILLIVVFIPRGGNKFSTGFAAHLGNLGATFNVELFENKTDKSVVLFHAPWCGHCKKFMPHWDNAASALKGQYNFVKVNGDDNKELMKQHGVSGFPTVKYFGKAGDSGVVYNGERSADALQAWLKQQN